MRKLLAVTLLVIACGGTKPKKESSMVTEGSETPPTCCCKTMPLVGEHDIQPIYKMEGRMECSSDHGDCVDDVQCNAAAGSAEQTQTQTPQEGKEGVPPPPNLPPER